MQNEYVTHCYWENRMTAIVENSLTFLFKLNIHFLHDSAITFLDIYHEEKEIYIHVKGFMQIFIAALFVITPNWKQSK